MYNYTVVDMIKVYFIYHTLSFFLQVLSTGSEGIDSSLSALGPIYINGERLQPIL